jgi:hypothetical protein
MLKRQRKKGEEETSQPSLSSKREVFIDARVVLMPKTAMMKLKTAKNHSVVPCRSSSYRLGIIKMTLFCCCCSISTIYKCFSPGIVLTSD